VILFAVYCAAYSKLGVGYLACIWRAVLRDDRRLS